jgi:hypothetical protein
MTWRNPPSSAASQVAPRLKNETEETDRKDHQGSPVEVLRVRLSTNVPFPSRTVRLVCDRPILPEACKFNFEYEGVFFNTPAGQPQADSAADGKAVKVTFDPKAFSSETILVAELASAGAPPKLVSATFA